MSVGWPWPGITISAPSGTSALSQVSIQQLVQVSLNSGSIRSWNAMSPAIRILSSGSQTCVSPGLWAGPRCSTSMVTPPMLAS